MHEYAALGDYQKVRVLLAGLTDAESYEYRQAGYLRALQILTNQLWEIEALVFGFGGKADMPFCTAYVCF